MTGFEAWRSRERAARSRAPHNRGGPPGRRSYIEPAGGVVDTPGLVKLAGAGPAGYRPPPCDLAAAPISRPSQPLPRLTHVGTSHQVPAMAPGVFPHPPGPIDYKRNLTRPTRGESTHVISGDATPRGSRGPRRRASRRRASRSRSPEHRQRVPEAVCLHAEAGR